MMADVQNTELFIPNDASITTLPLNSLPRSITKKILTHHPQPCGAATLICPVQLRVTRTTPNPPPLHPGHFLFPIVTSKREAHTLLQSFVTSGEISLKFSALNSGSGSGSVLSHWSNLIVLFDGRIYLSIRKNKPECEAPPPNSPVPVVGGGTSDVIEGRGAAGRAEVPEDGPQTPMKDSSTNTVRTKIKEEMFTESEWEFRGANEDANEEANEDANERERTTAGKQECKRRTSGNATVEPDGTPEVSEKRFKSDANANANDDERSEVTASSDQSGKSPDIWDKCDRKVVAGVKNSEVQDLSEHRQSVEVVGATGLRGYANNVETANSNVAEVKSYVKVSRLAGGRITCRRHFLFNSVPGNPKKAKVKNRVSFDSSVHVAAVEGDDWILGGRPNPNDARPALANAKNDVAEAKNEGRRMNVSNVNISEELADDGRGLRERENANGKPAPNQNASAEVAHPETANRSQAGQEVGGPSSFTPSPANRGFSYASLFREEKIARLREKLRGMESTLKKIINKYDERE